jgi:hypothetical protein
LQCAQKEHNIDQIQLVLLSDYELTATYSVLGGKGGREGILMIPNYISTNNLSNSTTEDLYFVPYDGSDLQTILNFNILAASTNL